MIRQHFHPRFDVRLLLAAVIAPFLALGARAAAPAPARGAATEAATAPFTFAALGCLPYQKTHDALPAFKRLIAEINRHAPAFTVHLGDIMASDERCTDELLRQRRADFGTFTHPLIYTPGDNEWTDTHSEKAGGYDPRERLAKLRELFFAEERSIGQNPLPLVTQRRDARFAAFVENARWTRGGVVFATVHVVGSQNNYSTKIPHAMDEWRERDLANEAWLRATFAEARQSGAPGVALFFQANPFAENRGKAGYDPGFERFLKTVEQEARAFAKPVLLVHADEHRYRLESAVRFHAEGERLTNVTRLETFGEANVHAVLVTVDPGSPAVFLAGPLLVPGNALPKLPRPKAAK